MTEWWEFTKVVIIPLVFGAYAFGAGAYAMAWMIQRSIGRNLVRVADDARKGRKEIWDSLAQLKENELHHLKKKMEQLERKIEGP